MIPQLDNKVLSSFYQWFDHTLLDQGQAYENKTAALNTYPDTRYAGIYTYASPHKQWVSDSSIAGATIPSGVSINNSFTPFDSTLFPDWDEGRVFSTSAINSSIQASYATKNFNVYVTNDNEEDIIFHNRYEVNPFYTLPSSGIAPYKQAVPACFLTYNNTDSEAYSIGSSDFQKESLRVRAIVMTNMLSHMDACLSIFRQQKDKCFALMDLSDHPYNMYGALKSSLSGTYNYDSVVASQNRELVHIDKVNTSKFFAGSHEFINKGMQISFINFDLTYFRSP